MEPSGGCPPWTCSFFDLLNSFALFFWPIWFVAPAKSKPHYRELSMWISP